MRPNDSIGIIYDWKRQSERAVTAAREGVRAPGHEVRRLGEALGS